MIQTVLNTNLGWRNPIIFTAYNSNVARQKNLIYAIAFQKKKQRENGLISCAWQKCCRNSVKSSSNQRSENFIYVCCCCSLYNAFRGFYYIFHSSFFHFFMIFIILLNFAAAQLYSSMTNDLFLALKPLFPFLVHALRNANKTKQKKR